MSRGAAVAIVVGTLVLGACGERIQTTAVGGEKKSDTKSWDANNSIYLAPGWTPGDKASWEAQLRARAQSQNDFAVAK